MLISFIRTLILYISVVITMRIMGKTQIGQLQPFELVLAVLIADLASVPMADVGIPLVHGLIPILALLMSQMAISYITLKSNRARKIVCGAPSILVENGRLVENELKRLRYNVNDLLEQLRLKNFPNINDVEFAILETDGQLSVIPKSTRRPVITQDLHVPTEYEGLPVTLVVDGHILEKDLAKIGQDKEWLLQQLKSLGYQHPSQVLLAVIDSNGKIFAQRKQGR